MLRAAGDLGRDPHRLELLAQVAARPLDVVLALVALLADQLLDLVVLAWMERGEREVLQLPLDRVDAEPVRQRREDLQRLLRLLLLLVLRHRAERAHVVQAIGELDQDDPDVAGHRDHHLAVVLGLAIVAALEGDARELGDAVHERRDLLAELAAHLVQRRARVLDRVVQQRGGERGRVEPHPGADLRDAERMHDEVLAAGAALIGMTLAGEEEGALDELAVDALGGLAGVLSDDREEVAEHAALLVAEAVLGACRSGVARLADGRSLELRPPARTPLARRRAGAIAPVGRRGGFDGGLDLALRAGLAVCPWQLRHPFECRPELRREDCPRALVRPALRRH